MNPSRERRKPKEREWDALPGAALVNIFRRTTIGHRARSLSHVCKNWAEASRDPRCWTSMIPDGYNYDDIFVKRPNFKCGVAQDPLIDLPLSKNSHHGVSRLEALIQRADGGLYITSIYLLPFGFSCPYQSDNLLRIIARSCPNLKHLSFGGLYGASIDAILDVFRNCTKLELVDFGDGGYMKPVVLTVIGNYCLNLRGIRASRSLGGFLDRERSATLPALVKCFPKLMLLNLASGRPLMEKELQSILSGFPQLQYLKVTTIDNTIPSIQRAHAQIPEFVYSSK